MHSCARRAEDRGTGPELAQVAAGAGGSSGQGGTQDAGCTSCRCVRVVESCIVLTWEVCVWGGVMLGLGVYVVVVVAVWRRERQLGGGTAVAAAPAAGV
jgi:hypothetical protein